MNYYIIRSKEFGLMLAADIELQLESVKQRIVQAFNPEKIILFGSYAYGDPGIDSDIDLLIIMKSKERPAIRSAQISKLIRPRPFPMDILVRTPEEIDNRLKIGDRFIEEIISRGRILYDRRISG